MHAEETIRTIIREVGNATETTHIRLNNLFVFTVHVQNYYSDNN